MQGILTRRSIRKFKKTPISEDIIEQVLRAAMAAPSAGNCQPWHFVVLRDHAVMDKIPEFHPHSKMLLQAAAAIVVCWDKNSELADGYGIQDASAATENILLAAHSLGLGAVWLGIFPRQHRVEKLKKLLNLPEHIIPLGVVAIGHPDEKKPPANRFDPQKVHFEKW
ncbi:MAG: nitroreductase family protein [Calditrichaeota bacterium]|nr:nitroreductase family protein [Calditrichota bacterium]